MSVVSLTPAKSATQEAREDSVRILEQALKMAKEGQVSELVLLMKQPDGYWHDDMTLTTQFSDWIGKLEILKQGWITSYLRHHV